MANHPPEVVVRFPIAILQLANAELVRLQHGKADKAELREGQIPLGYYTKTLHFRCHSHSEMPRAHRV